MGRPLDDVDLTVTMSPTVSAAEIARTQKQLTTLTLTAAGLLGDSLVRPSTIVLIEGFDAAGKGGAIKRLTGALDPRHVRVVPIGPPSPIDLAHHFLWRFQDPLPARGGLTVFDRSWYGRLLVERVEGLISHDEIARSAREIVEFERALVSDGAVIVKIWLSVSSQEQLRRFEKRRDSPTKQWKLTEDDWRNRARRDDYVEAANDMIERTDHEHARWHVVSGEDKHAARVAVLHAVTHSLEHALSRHDFEAPGTGIETPPSD